MPITLRDSQNLSQNTLHEAISSAFGEFVADFVRSVASVDDFSEFSRTMDALGFATISSELSYREQDKGMGASLVLASDSVTPVIAHAVACARYPFISEYVMGLKEGDDPRELDAEALSRKLSFSMLSSLDSGWMSRFGLAMCEDARTLLERSADPVSAFKEYGFTQIKMMYARLRWYAEGIADDTVRKMMDLTALYEVLSVGTCVGCGSFSHVRVDRDGNMLPLCMECRVGAFDQMDNTFGDAKERKSLIACYAKMHGYDEDSAHLYVPDDISDKVRRYLVACMTKPDFVIASDESEQFGTAVPYERLRLECPDLQIFKLVEEHDVQVMGEQAEHGTDEDDFARDIDDAVRKSAEAEGRYELTSRERTVQVVG